MAEGHRERATDPGPAPFLAAEDVYRVYETMVNPLYPAFLRKLGLDHPAARAEGAVLEDSAGRRYVDCVGGYGVFNLGHNHPAIVQALIAQLGQLQLATRPLLTPLQAELALALAAVAPEGLTCSFLCNSGSEAVDSAMKLARLCGPRKRIVAAEGAFHGFTYGALSASGKPSFRRPFEPCLPEVVRVPFNDLDAMDAATEGAAAVLIEPIQHESGMSIPGEGYLRGVREICSRRGALMILDEVKTGMGKTGTLFACERWGVVPDVLVLGKSLGGGLVPVGAVVARPEVWRRFGMSFSMSASSYGGNALACRAAIAAIGLLTREGFLADAAARGSAFQDCLRALVRRRQGVLRDALGLGFLAGVRAESPALALDLCRGLIRRGVLALPAYGDPATIMLEPPLVITVEQANQVVAALDDACSAAVR